MRRCLNRTETLAAEIPASRAYKDKRDDGEFAARWREALCEGYDLLESLPRKEMFRAREPDAPGIRIGSGEHR